jgi:hypothetical protein
VESQGNNNIEVIYEIGNKWMEQKRDEIANRMWADYQEYIQNR